MASTLNEKKFVKIEKSSTLIEDFQACGINTLMNFLDTASSGHKITIENLKKIFDYNEDGISLERHKFNKFNVLLKQHGIPYKVYRKGFSGHQDLFKHLTLPVPVFFDLKVIRFIRKSFKHSGKTFNFGHEDDLFKGRSHHLLLLVGYGNSGDKLYFIDPVYQLPYYDKKDLNDREKLCTLNTRDFYECVKCIKEFVHFKRVKI